MQITLLKVKLVHTVGVCITKHNQLSSTYHNTKISRYDIYHNMLFHEIDLKFMIEYINSAYRVIRQLQ